MKKVWIILFGLSLGILINAQGESEGDVTYVVPLIETAPEAAEPGTHIFCDCGDTGVWARFNGEADKALKIEAASQRCLSHFVGIRRADFTCRPQPKYRYYCLDNWHYKATDPSGGVFGLSSPMYAPSLSKMRELMNRRFTKSWDGIPVSRLGHLINCYPGLPNYDSELDHFNAIFDDFNHKCQNTLARTCNDRAMKKTLFMECVRNSPLLRSDTSCLEFFGLN